MGEMMTEEELAAIEKSYRDTWRCGCNAGGMCGCYLDDEGFEIRSGKRIQMAWDDGPRRPDLLALVWGLRARGGVTMKQAEYKDEIAALRAALWDFVDVTQSVGPCQVGSAVWHHALRVLGDRREDEVHGRAK